MAVTGSLALEQSWAELGRFCIHIEPSWRVSAKQRSDERSEDLSPHQAHRARLGLHFSCCSFCKKVGRILQNILHLNLLNIVFMVFSRLKLYKRNIKERGQ